MRPDVHQLISSVQGKMFLYKSRAVRILYANEDSTQIITDKGLIMIPDDVKAKQWFNEEFLPIDEYDSVTETKQEQRAVVVPGFKGEPLIETIYENIRKVQSNPDYIPQAEAVNNSINTLMNVVKVQMQLMKSVK